MLENSTIDAEQFQKVAAFVSTHELARGVGAAEKACSIASINLALFGRLTDDIPSCMSQMVGHWIIRIQDAMPHQLRNAMEWRELLPFAAGTGRDTEQERLRGQIIRDWFYDEAMPHATEFVEAAGFGKEWKELQRTRTPGALAKMRVVSLDIYGGKRKQFADNWDGGHAEKQAFYSKSEIKTLQAISGVCGGLSQVFHIEQRKYSQGRIFVGAEFASATVELAELIIANSKDNRVLAYLQTWEKLNPAGLLAKLVK